MEKNFVDHRGEPRVVITGMGAVTPVGNTVEEAWESLMVGRSGISRLINPQPVEAPLWLMISVGVTIAVKAWMAVFARQLAKFSKSNFTASSNVLSSNL